MKMNLTFATPVVPDATTCITLTAGHGTRST